MPLLRAKRGWVPPPTWRRIRWPEAERHEKPNLSPDRQLTSGPNHLARGAKLGANADRLRATSSYRQPSSLQVNAIQGDSSRLPATQWWCLLSLIAAAVALP
jgi:hypothetical protein